MSCSCHRLENRSITSYFQIEEPARIFEKISKRAPLPPTSSMHHPSSLGCRVSEEKGLHPFGHWQPRIIDEIALCAEYYINPRTAGQSPVSCFWPSVTPLPCSCFSALEITLPCISSMLFKPRLMDSRVSRNGVTSL